MLRIFEEFANASPPLCKLPTRKKFAAIFHTMDRVFSPGSAIVDLGGGLNPLNGVMARLGASVTVLDIFEYDLAYLDGKSHHEFAAECGRARTFLQQLGVALRDCDLCKTDLTTLFTPNSVDAIVSHHCFEHFHQSPRVVLESSLVVLKPGGCLLIEVPNAVNLLKRLQVMVGQSNYTSYDLYYDANNYTGHIREYTASDFTALARKLNLEAYTIYGKNWFGTLYEKLGDNAISSAIDFCLQSFPGLCGSLFLEYRKPTQ